MPFLDSIISALALEDFQAAESSEQLCELLTSCVCSCVHPHVYSQTSNIAFSVIFVAKM